MGVSVRAGVDEPMQRDPKAIKRVLEMFDTGSTTANSRAEETTTAKEVRNGKAENVTCLKVLPGTRICLEATVKRMTDYDMITREMIQTFTGKF